MRRVFLSAAIVTAVLVAVGCGSSGDTTGPGPVVGPVVTSTLQCKQPDGSLVQCDIVLANAGGFKVTLSQRQCNAAGDTIRVTKPLESVLTTDACYSPAVGTVWTFPGPYAAGTAVNMVFTSGSYRGVNVGSSFTSVIVSGAAPTWTLSYDDGGDPHTNQDVILTVDAT